MFRVANLSNLFWDNGSFKYPNTYPKLIDGKTLNKKPVMTSPTTGWVVLEGDWNYCEYEGNLFFLKKSSLISHKRNKWMYVLIKDHICSLFKNRADVYASGTLLNTDINNLKDNDFQYTFPVFNNYTKRILVPINKEEFNWRAFASKTEWRPKENMFPLQYELSDQEFSDFVAQLEINNKYMTNEGKRKWDDVIKKNKYLVLLGRLDNTKQIKGWKNELVSEINKLLIALPARMDIVAGKITGDTFTSATRLNGRFAISYTEGNSLFKVTDEKYQVDIDLSGLTDIELINFDTPTRTEKFTLDSFNLFVNYDEHKVSREYRKDEALVEDIWVHKLCKRVRLPYFNKYSSRAIYFKDNEYTTAYWNSEEMKQIGWLFSPQKIYIDIPDNKKLIRKTTYRKSTALYRSVYLYYWNDWNCLFTYSLNPAAREVVKERFTTDTWVDPEDCYEKAGKIAKQISGDRVVSLNDFYSLQPLFNEYYKNYYPWTRNGYSDIKEPINLGWLLGQFSEYIEGQENQYETNYPFLIKTGLTGSKAKLKRLQGFTDKVVDLIHLDCLYTNSKVVSSTRFTLDVFAPLSRRNREISKEEDFYIGEKLLFTTWGMAPYILFQPASTSLNLHPWVAVATALQRLEVNSRAYSYYQDGKVDNQYAPELFFKWISPSSYQYPYSCFDDGRGYFLQHAKDFYKKAYDDFKPLTPYKRFYENQKNYKELKQHIVKNTGAYFKTEEIDFNTTPIKELKVGDVFFSQGEFIWFQDSEIMREGGGTLSDAYPTDFLYHHPSLAMQHNRMQKRNYALRNNDIVVYLNPKDKKVYIGQVSVWTNNMKLPYGQTIADLGQLDKDSSPTDYVSLQYVRITPLMTDRVSETTAQGYNTLEELITVLKKQRWLKKLEPNDLKELRDSGRNYLFNLKGTPFFCMYDRQGKVSLIFKNKMSYEQAEHIPN